MRENDALIYRYLDRELDAEGCARLSAWLAADPAHARRFALLASEQYQVRELTRATVLPPTVDAQADLMRSLLSMEQSADVEPVAWEAPKRRRPASRRRHAEMQHAGGGAGGRPRSFAIPSWVVGGSVVAAALVVLALVLRPTTPPPTSTPPPPGGSGVAQASAVIESGLGAYWSSASGWSGDRGDRLPTGRVELSAGEVTVRFDGGARVVLTGPCVFEVEDGRAMRLETGRAVVASAPWEDGFAVSTPHQRIVDRHTTFGVEALAVKTRVQVFRGAVDLYTPDRGGDAGASGAAGASGGGGELVARASALQAFETRRDGVPEPAAFDVQRFRTASSAALLPVVSRRTVVFREGEAGYAGTSDTWFSPRTDPSESAGFADGAYLRVGSWTGVNQQAVVRFDGLFGEGASRVPAGAEVERATLVLHNPDTIRDSFGNASPQGDAFAVYRMRVGWSERDAYAAAPWAGGATPQVDTDGREADAQPLGDSAAMLTADHGYIIPANSRIAVDITPAVADWARGGANHGLLLQSLGAHPRSVTADQDGDALFVASSDYAGDPSLRPALEVTYLVAEAPQP